MTNFSNLSAIAALVPDFAPLPEQPMLYFLPDPDAVMIPLSNLNSLRLRPEGIRHAAKLMADAAAGRLEPRQSILVAARADGQWDVLDGNSTIAIARLSRWVMIPCRITVVAS